jgi:hypothetical protein
MTGSLDRGFPMRSYERRIDVSPIMILAAMGDNLMRRNAHLRISKWILTNVPRLPENFCDLCRV